MNLTDEQIESFIENREIGGYKIIQDKLVNNSIDDGDANPHEVIIWDYETDTYYEFTYDEWIGPGLEVDDFDSQLIEVEPVEITITTFKVKENN